MVDPNSERIGKTIRRYIRIETPLEVRFQIEGDESGTTYQALTKNISRGGACIEIRDHQSPLRKKIEKTLPNLRVSLFLRKDGESLDVVTKTAWISGKIGWFLLPSKEEKPLLLGMAFDGMAEEDAGKIDVFIEEIIRRDRESITELEERILSKIYKSHRPRQEG